MYNEERKLKFLATRGSSAEYGVSIFNTIEPAEERYGTDLAELPAEALQVIFDKSLGIRERSTKASISFIRAYCSWCKENGFEVTCNVDDISINSKEKIRNAMVASPKHLEVILDKAFDPVEERTMDCIYRCFLWLAFSGMEETEAIEVKVDEVDFEKMLVRHGGGEYELYKEALPAFRNACTSDEFVYLHPKYSKKILRKRFAGEYIMRGIRSGKIEMRTIRAIVGKHINDIGSNISYQRLCLSGAFYRAYELERAGFTPDFSALAIQKEKKANRNCSKHHKRKELITRIERDYMRDYLHWKEAFA